METTKLKNFAQFARRTLMGEISAKLKMVLATDSVARRESQDAVKTLDTMVLKHGEAHVVEQVSYTWFNRFCALRFMDVNRYSRIGIVSPAEGQFQPEILAEAKMGHIDEEMVGAKVRQQVFALLDGKSPSNDPQGEAYRLLVVAACNNWHTNMPFLFERIADYTELLMPDDLLSGKSILAYTRETMTPDVCQDVEVIGWLYQFYISEKKEDVFADLKKNKKISPENIPAATQLFTPRWIVRYLVENSLGRLWLLNRPASKLIEKMDYYIKPAQPETDFLRITKPEEIKVCDPACGSGHMLVYAFDLLYAIYEEEGYDPADIPEKILTNNLYGIEIDERAGELAAFALTMKARSKQRRFFGKKLQPKICVLKNIAFEAINKANGLFDSKNNVNELDVYMDFIGRDLFTAPLQNTLRQFEEADNFGSLIRPEVTDVAEVLKMLDEKDVSGQLLLHATHQKVLQALQQADYLSPKYHVVIANPPYMGGNGMNARLGSWAKENYPDSKSDLFAMFIERNLDLVRKQGSVGMITMQSWMFLSSFESLRTQILNQDTILSMAHLGARAFDSIGGEVVSTTAFVLQNGYSPSCKGSYLRLIDGNSESKKETAIRTAIYNPKCGWFYLASAADFKKIPGSPIAYWVNENILLSFTQEKLLGDIAQVKIGMGTGKNDIFVHDWWEVNHSQIDFSLKDVNKLDNSNGRYFPYNKGGDYRLWYGNLQKVVWFDSAGRNYMNTVPGHRENGGWNYYFKQGLTWSFISSSKFGVRSLPSGFVFDVAGSMLFLDDKEVKYVLGFLSSVVCFDILSLLNPTLNYQAGNIKSLPIKLSNDRHGEVTEIVECNISLARVDWDAYEISWDFTSLPLIQVAREQLLVNREAKDSESSLATTLSFAYTKLREDWRKVTSRMKELEEENNRIFIEAYGLQGELTPEVPLKEITLTCNPHYRYGGEHSEAELETLLLSDTMRELVSYAVGCMFGRYSIDKPGLVLANQGETIEDYLKRVPEPSFPADDDNVIPMLDGDWFADDIVERFHKFLRVTFGDEHYDENIAFIEHALGKKGKPQDIRSYFLKDFYTDHVRRYKKRPIYWMFSSPKGSFNALIYMHRYSPNTASVVLNDYLREFRTKLVANKSHLEALSISASASAGEKTKALKELEKIQKILVELDDYERETLYPLASKQLAIDLDDGVKQNYPKFGAALKKIPGLDAKEDD